MTTLTPLASVGDTLVTIAAYGLAVCFIASVSVAGAALYVLHRVGKARKREALRLTENPRERIEVIGGGNSYVPAEDRWAA